MKNRIIIGFAFLCLVFLNSCNNPSLRNTDSAQAAICDSMFLGKTQNCLVDFYEIDPIFNDLLDSIINCEVKYPYYNKCYSSFLYWTSDIVPEDIPETELMCFTAIDRYKYNYKLCYGIFKFKDWYFICDRTCNRKFLRSTNKKINIDYLVNDTSSSKKELNGSNWLLLEKKGKVVILDSYQPYFPAH